MRIEQHTNRILSPLCCDHQKNAKRTKNLCKSHLRKSIYDDWRFNNVSHFLSSFLSHISAATRVAYFYNLSQMWVNQQAAHFSQWQENYREIKSPWANRAKASWITYFLLLVARSINRKHSQSPSDDARFVFFGFVGVRSTINQLTVVDSTYEVLENSNKRKTTLADFTEDDAHDLCLIRSHTSLFHVGEIMRKM